MRLNGPIEQLGVFMDKDRNDRCGFEANGVGRGGLLRMILVRSKQSGKEKIV